MASTNGMERPAESELPQVRRSHAEWQGVVGSLRDHLTLTEFFAVEASHVCANQTALGEMLAAMRDMLQQTLHGQRMLMTKFEELDGGVERLELFLARHFNYPLSQVYMGDVEALRARIREIADDDLREKLAAVLGEAGAAERLKLLTGAPELAGRIDVLTQTVRDGIALLAEEWQTIREADARQRAAEEAERQQRAEVEAVALRQAAELRAQEIARELAAAQGQGG